ncbi:MAG: hypothetical protein QXL00_06900 [Conexivisphaerales archaeon]
MIECKSQYVYVNSRGTSECPASGDNLGYRNAKHVTLTNRLACHNPAATVSADGL